MTETDVNTTTEEDDLDPLDREALERAMKLASRDPGRRWQLNSKLQDESWFEVATFAAYCMQCQNLHLKPWEDPPCWGSETPLGYHGDQREAWELCKRLLAAGLAAGSRTRSRRLPSARGFKR